MTAVDWAPYITGAITAASMFVAAVGAYFALKYDAKYSKVEMFKANEELKESLSSFKADIKEDMGDMRADIKVLNKLVADVAVQNDRLNTQAERIGQVEKRIDARMEAQERRWDELRHGRGFVKQAAS